MENIRSRQADRETEQWIRNLVHSTVEHFRDSSLREHDRIHIRKHRLPFIRR